MFSERGNDGIARPAAQWFKRHNPTAPAQGGARKSRAAKVAGQVATLGEHVRQLAWQYTQEQTKHATWIGELGVRVTTLTDAYDLLLENVNRMIDASNGVTRELNELFR